MSVKNRFSAASMATEMGEQLCQVGTLIVGGEDSRLEG